jgi:hypothetical protein
MITTRRVFVFLSHRHLTRGLHASKLLKVIVELVTIVLFLGSLDVTLWANVGIISQFSTIETIIRVNWRVISHWCT